MENITKIRKYSNAPINKEKVKPARMATTIANVEPSTEPIPFIPHIPGTKCLSPDSSNNFIPKGKGIPRKNPMGRRREKDIKTLDGKEMPRNKMRSLSRNSIYKMTNSATISAR